MGEYPELQEDLRGFIKRDEKLIADHGAEMDKVKLGYLVQGISTRKAILDALVNGRIQR